MATPIPDPTTLPGERTSDAELIAAARAGSASAYSKLWERHAPAATAYARSFARIAAADDLVSEAFARILETLRAGKGPTESFRPYLMTVVRNTAMNLRRAREQEYDTDDFSFFEGGRSGEDLALEGAERSIAARAFQSLPTRWQQALWYSEVEELSRTKIAELLGIKPNAVSALTFRAREALRTAWVQAHAEQRSVPENCRETAALLGGYVRGTLARRSHRTVDAHLEDCARCRAVLAELKPLGVKLPALATIMLAAGIGAGSTLFPVTEEAAGGAAAASMPLRRAEGRTRSTFVAASAATVGFVVSVAAAAALIASVQQPPSTPAAPEPGSREHAAPLSTPGPIPSDTSVPEPEVGGDAGEEPGAPASREESPASSAVGAPLVDQPEPQPVDETPEETPGEASDPVAEAPIAVLLADVEGWLLPRVAGRAEPGATVTVWAGQVALVAVVADAEGLWGIPEVPIGAGTYQLAATQAIDGRSSAATQLGTVVLRRPEVVLNAVSPGLIELTVASPAGLGTRVDCGKAVTLTIPAGAARSNVACPSTASDEVRVQFFDPGTDRRSLEWSGVVPEFIEP